MNQLKNKTMFFFSFGLYSLILICLLREWYLHNYGGVCLCVLSFILIFLFSWIFKKFHLNISNSFKIAIFSFIFSSSILGEVYHFYIKYPICDILLHTINGFLCVGLGVSLFDLLNSPKKKFQLSKIAVLLFSVCFSMTASVFWEFFEYGADIYFRTDMQKDRIVESISTVALNEEGKNVPVKIDGIDHTIIFSIDKDGNLVETLVEGGYLDIGIIDTMKDLFVNFIGAVCFSIFGYLYILNRDKYHFISHFIPVKREI